MKPKRSKGGPKRKGRKADFKAASRGNKRADTFEKFQTQHSAKCSKCSKKCQVPFKPTRGKPVLCSDCFEGATGKTTKKFSDRKGRSSASQDKLLLEINKKLDKILDALDID